jgi:hypothetical protein
MPTTDLLKTFGLSRNPFTDRTAEKTAHDTTSLYIHSDLRGFKPNDTTYVFFGKRGSGKTTIRLQMEEAYCTYNKAARDEGRSKGVLRVCVGPHRACVRAPQRLAPCVCHVCAAAWRTTPRAALVEHDGLTQAPTHHPMLCSMLRAHGLHTTRTRTHAHPRNEQATSWLTCPSPGTSPRA